MALADPLVVTYNAVAKNLNRINQDAYTATYYLDDSSNNMKFTATVKHTLQKTGAFPESHLMRLDVEFLDPSTKKTVSIVSSWGVMKTDLAGQDLVTSQRVQAAFLTAWVSGNTDKILTRQS